MAREARSATLLVALLAALLGPFAAAAVHAQAPEPAGGGKAHSLPADEVSSLLGGEGMGLASAAELNHYPGPRHLLDVADQIGLSAGQRDAIRRIYLETIDQARAAGRKVVDKEAELSEAFAEGKITEARLRALVAEIAELRGQLRLIHLGAHLKTRPLLSAEQVAKYEKLRGYTQD
jgi:Spy/CpxP family protein refolding chaperone